MKKSAVILCAVLGVLGGLLLTGIISVGLLFVGIAEGGDGYDLMIFAALIMLAVCVPAGALGNKLKRRLGIPAPVFIVCTCAAPLIAGIIERAKLNALANYGYEGLTEVTTRIWLTAAIAFLVGQCAAVLIFRLKQGSKQGSENR